VLADVEELCTTITVLDRGVVRFCGTPAALCRSSGEDNLERAFLRCIRTDVAAVNA
jgi:ABC-type Na+ transport system ATPase subunit NatA